MNSEDVIGYLAYEIVEKYKLDVDDFAKKMEEVYKKLEEIEGKKVNIYDLYKIIKEVVEDEKMSLVILYALDVEHAVVNKDFEIGANEYIFTVNENLNEYDDFEKYIFDSDKSIEEKLVALHIWSKGVGKLIIESEEGGEENGD